MEGLLRADLTMQGTAIQAHSADRLSARLAPSLAGTLHYIKE
jgi:hypothetical protein